MSWLWNNLDFLIRTCFEVDDEHPVNTTRQKKFFQPVKNSKFYDEKELNKLNCRNSPTERTDQSVSTVGVGDSRSTVSTRLSYVKNDDDVKSVMDTSTCRRQRNSTQDDLLKQKGLEIQGVLSSGRFGTSLLARLQKEDDEKKKHELVTLSTYHKAVLQDTYQQHVPLREMKLLKSFDHPMITNILGTFSDRNCLYFVSPLEVGGPLSHLLQNALTLGITDEVKNFHAACVVSVLKYAHSRDIIHRGLHPDSLLIDASGYLKVSDWGFAKHVVDRTYTLCGHVEYLCPEAIFHDSGYGKGADYWALGVLIYEMFVGRSAFAPGSLDFKYDGKYDDRVVISTGTELPQATSSSVVQNTTPLKPSISSGSLANLDRTSSPSPSDNQRNRNKTPAKLNGHLDLEDQSDHDNLMLNNILTREPVYPSYMPHPTKSIIQGLCQKNSTQRLGTRRGGNGIDDILRHIFFQDIEWSRLNKKLVTAPWLPSAAFTLGMESNPTTSLSKNAYVKHYPNFIDKAAASGAVLCGPTFDGYNCPDWNAFA